MICRQCEKEKLKSEVQSLGCKVTLISYFGHNDKNGGHHYHDPNIRTCTYSCSNDHTFQIKSRTPCPNSNCDYGGEESYEQIEE